VTNAGNRFRPPEIDDACTHTFRLLLFFFRNSFLKTTNFIFFKAVINTILFQSIELLLVPFDRFVAFVLARLALRLYSIPTPPEKIL
jgi:hypothetical protein